MQFIPGMQLCERFFLEAVKPLLEATFPQIRYSAGLIDSGSEVLGFDTERSTDHHWCPRVQLFLSPVDFSLRQTLVDHLSRNLPAEFLGFSTHFGNPDEIGVQLLTEAKPGEPINHRVEISTVESFFKSYLSIDPHAQLSSVDWLTLSEQKLKTVREGKIFHDRLGLDNIRRKLHYYPNDVWLAMMAAEWMKISQEEHFIGRTGEVGDEAGSKIIAARLVQSIMRLCFLMEKEYAPYSKWFGSAFSRLRCSGPLLPVLEEVLSARNWRDREKHLSRAYELTAELHNGLGITRPLAAKVSYFYDRPFMIIHGERFADELKKQITDPEVKAISADIGSVNQLTDTVNLLENNELLQRLAGLYR